MLAPVPPRDWPAAPDPSGAPPARCLVAVVELAAGAAGLPAAGRWQLEERLRAEGVRWEFSPTGLTLVLPVQERSPASERRLEAAIDAIAGHWGQAVTAVLAWSESEQDVALAVEEAREIRWLVELLGRPPGTYRRADVVLEAMIGDSSAARGELIDLLGSLQSQPVLLTTLEQFLAADLNHKRAAAALHIHRNTLDYRLRRIERHTGISPTTVRGIQVLGAALTARRLRAAARRPL